MEEWTCGEIEKRTSSSSIEERIVDVLRNAHKQQFFIDFYNKKFADNKLDASKVAMKKKGCATVSDSDVISECFSAYDDLSVVEKAESKEEESSKQDESSVKLVRCRNMDVKLCLILRTTCPQRVVITSHLPSFTTRRKVGRLSEENGVRLE